MSVCVVATRCRAVQRARHRNAISSPFFGGFAPPPPVVVDSTRAPPPRKLEAPPTSTVLVIGDSMADWLGYGLDETYAADQPDIAVERKIRAYSGLVRYDAKNETLDWPQVTKEALATEKPSAIVVMLGLNDRMSLRDGAPVHSGPQQKAEPASARPRTQQDSSAAADYAVA